jgi:hypothetical protein
MTDILSVPAHRPIKAPYALRLIHYTGWRLGCRDETAFPRLNTWRSWQDHILDLHEEISPMDDPPHWSAVFPAPALKATWIGVSSANLRLDTDERKAADFDLAYGY